MKKNIAIWMPGGVGGGYYSQGIPVIAKLVEDLSKEYAVRIYSLYPANPDFKCEGYQLFSIHQRITIKWMRWMLLSFLFLVHRVTRRYDLIYSFWGFPSGFIIVALAMLIRVPSVIHLQGGDAVYIPSISYGALKGFSKRCMLWAYRHCTVLIALTQFQKSKLIESGVVREIEVTPFGVDIGLFKPQVKRERTSVIHFLHVGNLLPVKDQITLLNAFALIANNKAAQLKIIGEDHLYGLIQKECSRLGLNDKVEFLPIQPYEQMPLHYAWADVLLMTSVYEGQCLAVSEAAACGVMIAGTRTGILSDWSDRCSIVVEVGDAQQLASDVIRVLDSPDVMRSLVDHSRREAIQKDRQWAFNRIKDCIDKALADS